MSLTWHCEKVIPDMNLSKGTRMKSELWALISMDTGQCRAKDERSTANQERMTESCSVP